MFITLSCNQNTKQNTSNVLNTSELMLHDIWSLQSINDVYISGINKIPHLELFIEEQSFQGFGVQKSKFQYFTKYLSSYNRLTLIEMLM